MPDTVPNVQPAIPSVGTLPAHPPHPLDQEWYLYVDAQIYGPYSGHQLSDFAKEGRINGASQVAAVGTEKWVRIAEEPKLAAICQTTRPQVPVPPTVTAGAGATVVNVTNHVSSPSPMLLLDEGLPFGPKSAGVALFLSFLVCGAGQMYCGRIGKGILMLIACIFLWAVFLGWIISIWSMIDAYSTAKQMNLRYMTRLQASMSR